MSENITITKVNYSKQRDRKVLQSCLKNWFSDPKALNLTDPRMSYPFRFEKWMKLSYSEGEKKTWILWENEWIVAYLSLSFVPEENRGHLFHLYVDREHRKRGHARKLIHQAESWAKDRNCTHLTLRVFSGNELAIKLYNSLGFELISRKEKDNLAMVKTLLDS